MTAQHVEEREQERHLHLNPLHGRAQPRPQVQVQCHRERGGAPAHTNSIASTLGPPSCTLGATIPPSCGGAAHKRGAPVHTTCIASTLAAAVVYVRSDHPPADRPAVGSNQRRCQVPSSSAGASTERCKPVPRLLREGCTVVARNGRASRTRPPSSTRRAGSTRTLDRAWAKRIVRSTAAIGPGWPIVCCLSRCAHIVSEVLDYPDDMFLKCGAAIIEASWRNYVLCLQY